MGVAKNRLDVDSDPLLFISTCVGREGAGVVSIRAVAALRLVGARSAGASDMLTLRTVAPSSRTAVPSVGRLVPAWFVYIHVVIIACSRA